MTALTSKPVRANPARSIAAHGILVFFTLLALSPIALIFINALKSRAAIFRSPLALPTPETFDLSGSLVSFCSLALQRRGQ